MSSPTTGKATMTLPRAFAALPAFVANEGRLTKKRAKKKKGKENLKLIKLFTSMPTKPSRTISVHVEFFDKANCRWHFSNQFFRFVILK